MRKAIVWIAVGWVLSVRVADAQGTSRRAMAEELLDLMNIQESIEKSFAMVKQMIPAQMEQMKQATGQTNAPADASTRTGKMMDMMAQEFSWDKLKDDYITLYAETFTEEEMKGIIAFYKSPVGQAFVKKQPELVKRSMELSQKMMMRVMPKIQAMMKELKGTAAPTAGARHKAYRINDAGNLKQIGLALLMYSRDHGKRFPGDLGVLYDEGYLTAGKVYPCPNFDTKPPKSGDDIRAGRCDYVYFGQGGDGPALGTTDPIAVTRPGRLADGYINVCYGDGHVKGFETIPADVKELLREFGE